MAGTVRSIAILGDGNPRMDGKVLIVDDLATNRIVYKVKLSAAFYQPILAADGESCLRLARSEAPDIILLDLMLPDLPGVEVLRRLRADPATRHIPIVIMTASCRAEDRLSALVAGADDVLNKPIDEQLLLARLRNLLRHRTDNGLGNGTSQAQLATIGLSEDTPVFERPATIGLITELPETALRWQHALQPLLSDKMLVLTRDEALAETGFTQGKAPDVYLIEADLGGAGGGLRLMSDLHSRGASRHAAMMIMAAGKASEQSVIAFDLGANDSVQADIPTAELAQRLRGMLRRKRQGDRSRASVQTGLRMAMIDPLTGLYNRRFALPQLTSIADRARAENNCFSLMILDLDRFKQVNDRHGHAAGDVVLGEVARRLTDSMRSEDLLARIGGEEFLIALPRTSLAEARIVAQRLARIIDEYPIDIGIGQSLTITASIGVAGSALPGEPPLDPADVLALVAEADRALMSSKAAGRNQVTVSRSAA